MTKVALESVDAVRRRLAVEIPAAEVTAQIERAYAQLKQRARVPGFRQGRMRGGTSRWLNVARIEMLAVSARETGQFALARSAASTKSHSATLGTAAITSRWICVIVHAAAMFSIITVAVVSIWRGW